MFIERGTAGFVNVLIGGKRMEHIVDNKWMNELACDARGKILCTMPNIAIILRNDDNLKNIAFNEMKECIDTTGEVPWNRSGKGWKQTDLACFEMYLEQKYDLYAPAKCKEALYAVLSSERQYHPVKQYLGALVWDGKERVDTLLIEYLGAEDTEYVRMVTRKTMIAAIARIYQPGIKYDTILVLCGAQGIGKSTLFSKLGGEWYSDSMTIADMKDKTAAEKLQGTWIMELSELAGLKKVDVETVKSFLSRTDDQYRVPYGVYVESHPRRSIMVATTNTTDGFLRDITGNRRFWPVLVTGKGRDKAWNLSPKEIDQIWAEAMIKYHEGEKLYLDQNVEGEADMQQRMAMESDPRQGLIGEYLEAESKNKICLMELWCECLGKERQDMRRSDAFELEGILKKIGGWKVYEGNSTGKMRLPVYGVQKTFVKSEANT